MQAKLRKVLAMLGVLAMLCTLLPLGAISVAAEDAPILSMDFEDGIPVFKNASVVQEGPDGSKCLKWSATGGYSTSYRSLSGVDQNSDIVITFKAKASVSGKMGITIQRGDWSSNYYTEKFDVTTSWAEYTIETNVGEYPTTSGGILFKFQDQDKAMDLYVDNLVVAKKPAASGGEGGSTTEAPVIDLNFNDGTVHFNGGASVVASGPDGSNCLKWTCSGGWSSTYFKPSGIEKDADYLITFKAKSSLGKSVFITIQDADWGDHVQTTFKPTTEWAEYSVTINTANAVSSDGKIMFKFQDSGDVQDLYIDDLKMAKIIPTEGEEEDVNMVLNGGFENGAESWKLNSSASIVEGGHNSDHALQMKDPGSYAEAATQKLTVKPNYQYELSFWSKRVSGTGAFNIIVCQSASPYAQFTKVSGQTWMNETSGNWVEYKLVYDSGSYTGMMLKFTAEAANAGTILIDDVVLREIPQASDDGFIKNGDFEIGEVSPWTTHLDTAVTKEAANNGKYGLMVKGNGSGYPGLAYQDFTTEVGHTYMVSFNYKAVSSGVNVQIKNNGTDVANKWINATSWTPITLEFEATATTSRINICGSGQNVTDQVYFDDFVVIEVKEPSFDGYIYNGDFEAGSLTKWSSYQQTTLSTDAAKNGKYGCKMIGNGGWGGTLNQKNIALEVGKTYKLSFWYKTPKNGLNMVLSETGNDDNKLAKNYLSGKSDWTLYEVVFESAYTTSVQLNFSGSGKNTTDEMWIDDIKIENLSGDEMDRTPVIANGGTSIRDVDDTNRGLAFRVQMDIPGIQVVNGNHYVPGTGSLKLFKYDEAVGTIVKMGAVVTAKSEIGTTDFTLDNVNDGTVVDVNAKYLLDLDETSTSFAVRVINIPDDHVGTTVYLRPYYIYELDGEQVTVYGDIASDSYEHVSSIRRSLKILAIGNSFSIDAMQNHLYDVLKSAEYDQVILGNLYIGGCSLDTHWSHMQSGSAAYEFLKNDDNGRWVNNKNYDILTALQEETWDVITIQQASPYSGKPDSYSNLQNAVNWINQHKTNPDAKVLWHMTWAYQQNSTHANFPDYNSDQMTMYNAILNAVQTQVVGVEGIDGVIPAGTAIQNMRGTALGDNLTADGYHLSDTYGDYIASLTWFAAITGESLNLVDYVPASVAEHAYNAKRAAAYAVVNPYEVSDLSEIVLLAGTDFQASTWEKNINNINGFRESIKNTDGYELFDGFLFTGDYTPQHGHDNATEGIGELDAYTDGFVCGDKFFAEGNHDAPTVEKLSPYGNNDPVNGPYGAFVIHEEDYGQFGGTSANKPGDDLKAYFDEKVESGWDLKKPIFVMTHVPLHFNWRTVSDYGAGKNAEDIVNALNYGGELGFNIFFLFGHNHSSDYDSYLGGAAIYLPKGDTMLIAKPENYKEYKEVELKFTYMNSGYVGYHADFGTGMDTTLTMTTFKIQADGSVIVTRYDANGYHNLKAKGVAHVANEHNVTIPVNEDVYGPQRIVTATSDEEYVAE